MPPMREPVVITGLGVVSATGTTREAFYDALAGGASGVRPHPIAADGVALTARVEDFGARQHIDPRALRRLARMSQMALVAAKEALAQAGARTVAQAPEPTWPSERAGVVLGTGLGTLRETMDFIRGYIAGGPEAASPLLFPSSVMNAPAGQVAIELALRGPNTTVNHRESSPLDALALAVDLLALRRADALLVGGVDEISDVMLLGYRNLAKLSASGLRPYAAERDGTVAGEGCAMLLVEREADARDRGARVLARVAGWASGGEPRPRVGWGQGSERAAEVMRAAISDAGLVPDDIDYVAGEGAGLRVDAIEAQALSKVFARPVATSSVLGQTGWFFSAGALRLASALYALERQALPGTVGAGTDDPQAPLPGLVREPRAASVRAVLVPSLAQGGASSALVLTRE